MIHEMTRNRAGFLTVAWGVLAATALISGLWMAQMGLGVTAFEIGSASVALNAGVVVSTLSIGGHYLLDVIVAALMTVATIGLLAVCAMPRSRIQLPVPVGELSPAVSD
jgi:membrane-associated phospholipid phosphatase